MVDLSHPALVRSQVGWSGALGIFVSAVNVDDGVIEQRPGMPEHGRTRDGSGLFPGVLLSVVNLYVLHRIGLGPTADEVDEAIAVSADDGVIHGDGNVGAAIPSFVKRLVDVYIAHGDLAALTIDDVASEEKNLLPRGGG